MSDVVFSLNSPVLYRAAEGVPVSPEGVPLFEEDLRVWATEAILGDHTSYALRMVDEEIARIKESYPVVTPGCRLAVLAPVQSELRAVWANLMKRFMEEALAELR